MINKKVLQTIASGKFFLAVLFLATPSYTSGNDLDELFKTIKSSQDKGMAREILS